MSTKSYTLADGSTVTVTATEQGIPFNEGMQALTKAIKARVNVRDGSSGSGGASSSSKLEPTLTVSLQDTSTNAHSLSYNAFTYTYNGDGQIFVMGLSDVLLFGENHGSYVATKLGFNESELRQQGYKGLVSQADTSSGGTVVPGFFVAVHATEGVNYAAKTAWVEYGWFDAVTGTIYEFVHSGTL